MQTYLIIGNVFSLLSSLCIAVSAMKKKKDAVIWWQLWNIVFSIFSCVALKAYAALVVCSVVLIRNILAYKRQLNNKRTLILVVLCVVAGLWVNNLGIIGLLAILASTSYTFFMYITKDAQQMRWALLSNLILWTVHDTFVQAYPSAVTCVILSIWTAIQIIKNRSSKSTH